MRQIRRFEGGRPLLGQDGRYADTLAACIAPLWSSMRGAGRAAVICTVIRAVIWTCLTDTRLRGLVIRRSDAVTARRRRGHIVRGCQARYSHLACARMAHWPVLDARRTFPHARRGCGVGGSAGYERNRKRQGQRGQGLQQSEKREPVAHGKSVPQGQSAVNETRTNAARDRLTLM